MQCRGRCWHKPAVSASKFVGCVSCVSERPAAANHQQAFSLKPPDRCLRWRAATFVSELILIIRLPVRPSRLKAISMPTVLRKVWQRRNRPARAARISWPDVAIMGRASGRMGTPRRRSFRRPRVMSLSSCACRPPRWQRDERTERRPIGIRAGGEARTRE
jgi:hypothetical protein